MEKNLVGRLREANAAERTLDIDATIERAIELDRERCAKIAAKYQDFGGLSAAIAAEIRSGE